MSPIYPSTHLPTKNNRLLVAALIFAWLFGCEVLETDDAHVADTAGENVSVESPVFDAGVIFAGRESYLCIAGERIGLSAADSVASLVSSCGCVLPSCIEYKTPSGTASQGIMLRFIPEQSRVAEMSSSLVASTDTNQSLVRGGADPISARNETNRPMYLGVVVDIGMADGTTRQLIVNLLHTSLEHEVDP